MISYLKKVLKRLNLFFFFRIIYKFIFCKGYIYRKFQSLFTNIKRRNKIAYFEREIIKLLFFKSRGYFESKIDENDEYSTQLNQQGCTVPFKLETIEKNKKNFFRLF